jgi:polar amino acid transport system permease protein
VLTVEITLISSALAMVLGLVIAILRMSRIRAVAMAAYGSQECVRRTPLLIQLYILFYVLPSVGILLSPFVTGVVGLAIYYSAYISEVYRAGIENVPRGQWEAATTCNLERWQVWRHIILPQAVPPMIPPLANYFIAMFKDTPILAAITVLELMNEALTVANMNYRFLEPITAVGAFFLAVSIPSMALTRFLERRFGTTAT